jgi:hypothetical protein
MTEDTRRFVETVTGDAEGFLCVAVGRDPFRDDNGRYQHREWDEVTCRWPAQADDVIEYITSASALGDVYTCPYLMKEQRRAKGNAAQRALIHADVDQVLDEAAVAELGGFAVRSGSPGHGHVYVPLAWPVTPAQHEALCRGLAAHLGGDAKYSDNDLLRPPGTLNYKSAADGGEPAPVTVTWSSNGRVDPRDIAEKIGVDLANPTAGIPAAAARSVTHTGRTAAEVDLAAYPSVRAALENNTGDRSADTYRIAAVCHRTGLTLAETTGVLQLRGDLAERLDGRTDDDLLDIWLKLDDESRTAARPTPTAETSRDGAELLDEVHGALTKFVVFPHDSAAVATSLWVAATHALPAWQHATRLVIRSPQKRCGKSRLLDVVERLVFKPLPAMDASVAAIYRSLGDDDMKTPTLLIDEADVIFGTSRAADDNADLRQLLNGGWQRGRIVIRCVGPTQTPTPFATYAMAALASIRGLPDTIMDRGVVIDLKRRRPGEAVARFRLRRDSPPLLRLRDQLTAWVRQGERLSQLSGAEPNAPAGVEDRAEDAWESLLAVADAAGGHWPDLARAACADLCARAEDEDAEIRLLADIEDIFTEVSDEFIPSQNLVIELTKLDEAPWRDTQLTAWKLARMLKNYDVRPSPGPGRANRGYWRRDFRDAFTRYNRPNRPDRPKTTDDQLER